MFKLTFFLVSVLTFIGFIKSRSIQHGYLIVFDAGSKNTRMSVYSFNKGYDIGLKEELYFPMEDGGLANYETSIQVQENFGAALEEADRIIPCAFRNESLIFLGATAGMRLLEIKNKSKSDQLLKYVRDFFNDSQYLFKSDNQVRILAGEEEGYSSWITANYLNGLLRTATTTGVIELGGSSLQVAFSVNNEVLNSNANNHLIDISVQNKNHKLYSHSYLCFGTTAIRNMYDAFIVRRENYAMSMLAACYPENYVLELDQNELAESPCVNGLMYGNEYEFVINPTKINEPSSITVTGNAKKDKCREEIKSIIPRPACNFGTDGCTMNGIYLPDISSKIFNGIGDMYESIYYMEQLLQTDFTNDLAEYDNATYLLCNMKYSKLKDLNTINNVGLGKKRLGRLCIENVYILQLFNIFGINRIENIHKVEKINDNKVNWVLGFAMKQIEYSNQQIN